MATTPHRSRYPRFRFIATLMLTLLAVLASSASAHAQTIAANYAASALRYSSGTNMQSCRGWSGDTDRSGRFYTVCIFQQDVTGDGVADQVAPALVEYSPAGVVQHVGWLPPEYYFGERATAGYVPLDVGVAPDGMTAYVSTGPNIDNLGGHPERHPYTGKPLPNGATSGAILRLNRQASGGWQHDTAFKAGPFLLSGNYWSARRLDVDDQGRLYTSVNAYVYELSPATGGVVSYFGGAATDGPGGRWIDGIDKAQGIAVSGDGSSIHVVDQQHQIVQRWLRIGATDWRRDTTFLLGVADAVGDYCQTTTHFQSPYDVAIDAAGDVYVMDTTCNRVQRFTSTGTFIQTVWQRRTDQVLELSHGFAVSWNGSVVLPTELLLLTRLDPPAQPVVVAGGPTCVDGGGLKIVSVDAPRRSAARTISIAATVTGDCAATHQVRVLGNRMGRARWTDGTSTRIPLSGWNGRKVLTVQVRDGRGAVATYRIVSTLALAQPKLIARSVVRLRGSGCSTVHPLRRVGGGSLRLTDRCAVIRGRVLRSQRRGSGIALEVLIPAGFARAIYQNAVGPVKLWVVTDTRTQTRRAPRRGRDVIVVGSIVATRTGAAAYLIPADVVVGR